MVVMQEGVASEASAFAGHFGLDNLILIYDSNTITLDAHGQPQTQSEDTRRPVMRPTASTFRKSTSDDMQAFLDALQQSRKSATTAARSSSLSHSLDRGKEFPRLQGTCESAWRSRRQIRRCRAKRTWPAGRAITFVSKETYAYFAEHKKKLLADYARWEKMWQRVAR